MLDKKDRSRSISGSIGLFFGGLWGVIGALSLPSVWQLPIILVVALISTVLVIRLWRTDIKLNAGTKKMFGRRAYLFAVVLEILAIEAASVLLPRIGLQHYFIEVVGVIVGLHFIGLWKATKSTRFLKIAAGMCVASIVGAIFPYTWGLVHLRDFVTGFGNALVLWIGASQRS